MKGSFSSRRKKGGSFDLDGKRLYIIESDNSFLGTKLEYEVDPPPWGIQTEGEGERERFGRGKGKRKSRQSCDYCWGICRRRAFVSVFSVVWKGRGLGLFLFPGSRKVLVLGEHKRIRNKRYPDIICVQS